MTDPLGALAAEMRAEAARNKIPITQLATHIGQSRDITSKKLNGTREMTARDVLKISHALGLSATELVARAEAAALKETQWPPTTRSPSGHA